jgi:hypothetical protein
VAQLVALALCRFAAAPLVLELGPEGGLGLLGYLQPDPQLGGLGGTGLDPLYRVAQSFASVRGEVRRSLFFRRIFG